MTDNAQELNYYLLLGEHAVKKRLWGAGEGGDKISWHKLVFNIHFEISLLLLPLFLQLFRYSMPESPSILFPQQNVELLCVFFHLTTSFPKKNRHLRMVANIHSISSGLCKNLTLNDLGRNTICPLMTSVFFKLGSRVFCLADRWQPQFNQTDRVNKNVFNI